MHVVIRKVEDQLGISGSGQRGRANRLPDSESILCLNTKDRDDLKILYDGLRTIILKWEKEGLVAGLRDKLRLDITLLTSFNVSLVKYALSLPTCTGCLMPAVLVNLRTGQIRALFLDFYWSEYFYQHDLC